MDSCGSAHRPTLRDRAQTQKSRDARENVAAMGARLRCRFGIGKAQSQRKATMGSTRDARTAGSTAAAMDTANKERAPMP